MHPSALLYPRGISVVVPFYNEEQSVAEMHRRLDTTLQELGLPYELVFVNDGSSDRTLAGLKEVQAADPHVRIISLRRNFGQTAALAAGFDHARGDVIIPMDGDLQNDPGDIPRLLDKLNEGHDVVSGWRRNRQDTFLTRKVPSYVANWLIGVVTGVRLHDYGCTLKAYRREVLDNISLFGDMHRFIPALASWAGVSVAELEVTHHPRRYGQTKYGLSRTIGVLLDLITAKFMISYVSRPIRLLGPPGILLVLGGLALALILGIIHLGYGVNIEGKPLIAVLMFTTGIQFIMMGLLGEMIMRVYFEGQHKSIYVIKEIIETIEPGENGS